MMFFARRAVRGDGPDEPVEELSDSALLPDRHSIQPVYAENRSHRPIMPLAIATVLGLAVMAAYMTSPELRRQHGLAS